MVLLFVIFWFKFITILECIKLLWSFLVIFIFIGSAISSLHWHLVCGSINARSLSLCFALDWFSQILLVHELLDHYDTIKSAFLSARFRFPCNCMTSICDLCFCHKNCGLSIFNNLLYFFMYWRAVFECRSTDVG